MSKFDRQTLDLIDRAREVEIETLRPDGMPRLTVIWPIVDRGEVFVRSWRGDRAYWYQSALDSPDQVSIHLTGRAIPVRVVPAVDEGSISRCSRGYQSKYADDSATPAMVRPQVLGTTLRLEPR